MGVQLTVGQARAMLSYVWIILALPLFAIVFFQTVRQRYEWETGFGWLIPLLFPNLAIIVATWTLSETRKEQIVLKNRYVFILSLLFSIVYLLALYTVVWQMPLDFDAVKVYVEKVMRYSSWYLGAFQAIVVVVVGKFFLEEIPEKHSSPRKPRHNIK